MVHTKINYQVDFLIIGSMKCGTTSMKVYLNSHPKIRIRRDGEYFFHKGNWERGLRWYGSRFPVRKGILQGDGNEDCLIYPYAAKRIKDVLPNAKFIWMVRNPIDRAYSHWQHSRKNARNRSGLEDLDLSFRQVCERELGPMQEKIKKFFNKNTYDGNELFQERLYLTMGGYADQLTTWMKHFSRKSILFIKSEDFFKNPEKEYWKALDYLGVEHVHLSHYKNHQPSVGRGRKGFHAYEDMEKETRLWLSEYYKEKNQKFYNLTGINFYWEEEQ